MSGKAGHLPMETPTAWVSSAEGAGSERVLERLATVSSRRVEYFNFGFEVMRALSSVCVGGY